MQHVGKTKVAKIWLFNKVLYHVELRSTNAVTPATQQVNTYEQVIF